MALSPMVLIIPGFISQISAAIFLFCFMFVIS